MPEDFQEFKPEKKKRGGSQEPPRNVDGGGRDYDDDGDEFVREFCPLRPLGHRQGTYYFLTPSGELRHLSDRGMTSSGLLSLLDGDVTWAAKWFTASGSRGKKIEGAFDHFELAGWLIRECVNEGLFDPDGPVRGPGVWLGPGHRLIVHAGDELYVDGRWIAAREKIAGAIYPAWPAREAPDFEAPAAKGVGQALLAHLGRWRYMTPRGPEILLGLIAVGLLGAAPPIRVHGYVIAPLGSGKSALAEFCKTVAGAGAHDLSNDLTEGGLRQRFTNEALWLLLDEAEADDGKGHIAQVMEFLRRMSTGQGAVSTRGTPGGKHQTFTVTGAAILFSILAAHLKPADRSRFVKIKLDELPSGQGSEAAQAGLEAALADAALWSPSLRARAINRWPLFCDCLARYRKAFLSVGCSPRASDVIGTVLAGRDILIRDEPPSEEETLQALRDFAHLITDYADNEDEGEGQQCVAKLFSSPADLWRSGERLTVAEMVMLAMDKKSDDAGRSYARQLGKIGLRLIAVDERVARMIDARHRVKEGDTVLLVANKHEALEKLFADSRWKTGGWADVLRMPRMGFAWPDKKRFAGVESRCTALPPHWLPKVDQDEAPTPVKEGIPPLGEA